MVLPDVLVCDTRRSSAILRIYLADSVESAVLRKEVLCLVKGGQGTHSSLVHVLVVTYVVGCGIKVKQRVSIFCIGSAALANIFLGRDEGP